MRVRNQVLLTLALISLLPVMLGCHRSGSSVRVPAGDAAVLTGAAFKDGKLAVGMGWPATRSRDDTLYLLACFGADADGIDRFASQNEQMMTLGFSSMSVRGKAIFASFAKITPSDRPKEQALDLPSSGFQGTVPVTVRLYALRENKLRPVSNAVQIEYSAGGSG